MQMHDRILLSAFQVSTIRWSTVAGFLGCCLVVGIGNVYLYNSIHVALEILYRRRARHTCAERSDVGSCLRPRRADGDNSCVHVAGNYNFLL